MPSVAETAAENEDPAIADLAATTGIINIGHVGKYVVLKYNHLVSSDNRCQLIHPHVQSPT